jgi:hypothetical protein
MEENLIIRNLNPFCFLEGGTEADISFSTSLIGVIFFIPL